VLGDGVGVSRMFSSGSSGGRGGTYGRPVAVNAPNSFRNVVHIDLSSHGSLVSASWENPLLGNITRITSTVNRPPLLGRPSFLAGCSAPRSPSDFGGSGSLLGRTRYWAILQESLPL
jgi:hypothetical protein